MDTLTHALSGALLNRAAAPRQPTPAQLPSGARTAVGFLAAAFPDIDIILIWVDPLTYLNWHRAYTHSLILLPAWALILASVFRWALRRRYPLRAFYGVCVLALAAHIAGDVITAYGTRVLVPLSDVRVSLPTTFIIDPWFTAIIALGLLGSIAWRSNRVAAAGIALLIAYVGVQGAWYVKALALARGYASDNGLSPSGAHALPQPFLPVHWKLVVDDGETYRQAHIRLLGGALAPGADRPWWLRMAAAYRPPGELNWTTVERYGTENPRFAREAWRRPELAAFRQFAVFPYVYRLKRSADEHCAWFTDLRFTLEGMTPPFRYGACRTEDSGAWRLNRLGRW